MYTSRCLAFAFVCLFVAPLLSAAEVVEAPPEEGLKPIFDGKTLDGWDGDPRLWSVKDGVIRGETTGDKKANGNTFLVWKGGNTKDFELRVKFKVSSVNNSGIQYRSTHQDKARGNNKWVVKGYQHEIRNSNKLPSVAGFIYEEGGGRGRMAMVGDKTVWNEDGKKEVKAGALISSEEFAELFKVDEWNEVIIRAEGAKLQHYMNGRLVMDCVDNHPQRKRRDGVLAFQLHAGKPMWAEFKDIRFKTLD